MKYIIGDIHNNIKALEKLLELLKPAPTDTLIFLGDYVDKNIETQATIDRLLFLRDQCACIFLKGNHEYVWQRYLAGETERQQFLLTYGGIKTLLGYTTDAALWLRENRLDEIRTKLSGYLNLIDQTKDYYIVDGYVALHAGLRPEQLDDTTLQFTEDNYFLRPERMNLDRRYLDSYTLIAGHTHLQTEPWRKKGYINIDLGAAYGKYIGAFIVEEERVIRSDGKMFPMSDEVSVYL